MRDRCPNGPGDWLRSDLSGVVPARRDEAGSAGACPLVYFGRWPGLCPGPRSLPLSGLRQTRKAGFPEESRPCRMAMQWRLGSRRAGIALSSAACQALYARLPARGGIIETGDGRSIAAHAAVAEVALGALCATAARTLPMQTVPPYFRPETVRRMGTS